MHFTTLFSAASAIALASVAVAQSDTIPITGTLGNATIVTNNPIGPAYKAVFSHGKITGSVYITAAAPNGPGVEIFLTIQNLPSSGGPFLYHIHALEVNSTGNCLSAGGHLNPFERGEVPPCVATLPETCQVGDLSGKHGKITSDPFAVSYSDPYISTVPGQNSFVGNRSVVVHFANGTRLDCANFEFVSGTNASASANVTTTYPTTPQFTGAAAAIVAPLLSVFAIVAAVFLV